jgi:hypothetical protein
MNPLIGFDDKACLRSSSLAPGENLTPPAFESMRSRAQRRAEAADGYLAGSARRIATPISTSRAFLSSLKFEAEKNATEDAMPSAEIAIII